MIMIIMSVYIDILKTSFYYNHHHNVKLNQVLTEKKITNLFFSASATDFFFEIRNAYLFRVLQCRFEVVQMHDYNCL